MAGNDRELRVLGLVGSLRRASYNRRLAEAAREMAPEGMRIEIFDGLRDIPPYDFDVESRGIPGPVQRLKDAIAAADALLVATPEYNFSVPGVLKNAIDWVSRPPQSSPLNGRPAAIMGASTGIGGTIRAQLALRQVFLFTNTPTLVKPEVTVPRCADKFDGDGPLTDETTRGIVRQLVEALPGWVARFQARP
jgi:chromate reductase